MMQQQPFNEAELSVCNALFLDFCILGGMPAVVREYIERDNFEGSLAVQKQLIIDYEEDVRKDAEGMDQTRILNVFRRIPLQLARDNKKFQISKVVYKGALYENVVGEALVKSGYGLYYYKKEDSTLEEDFFVRTAADLIPVEVKATNGRAKSLRTLIESDKCEDIHYGIKLTGGNIGFDGQIYTFPYFCAFLLKRYLKRYSAL